MLAQRFERNFRKVVALSLIAATVMGFAIGGFAFAASQTTTFAVAASESRPATPKTKCKLKAERMLQLTDATAPVIH